MTERQPLGCLFSLPTLALRNAEIIATSATTLLYSYSPQTQAIGSRFRLELQGGKCVHAVFL
jgi:hypothetical protein